jgi:hypothetical protein
MIDIVHISANLAGKVLLIVGVINGFRGRYDAGAFYIALALVGLAK